MSTFVNPCPRVTQAQFDFFRRYFDKSTALALCIAECRLAQFGVDRGWMPEDPLTREALGMRLRVAIDAHREFGPKEAS